MEPYITQSVIYTHYSRLIYAAHIIGHYTPPIITDLSSRTTYFVCINVRLE